MRLSLLAAAAPLLGSATAATVELWWNITYVQNANPDQLYPRQVIGINGTWPPPLVEVNQGDTLLIHATNDLDGLQGTTLHGHGLFFNGTGYFDGASGVTQCPIPPQQTLSYSLATDNQWGTYWIHSHFSGQYVDGLRTPLIIHPPKEVQKYDDEYTIVMSDWYHQQHATLMLSYMSIYNPTGGEPTPNSAIAYVAHNGSYMTSLSDIANGNGVSSSNTMNAKLNFEPGKTYRIRFMNVGAFAMFNVHMDGHNMSIIEVDGLDVEPYQVDVLPLSVAQRFSVLVTARNDTNSNWPITMAMDGPMFDSLPADLVLNITAQIVYSESAELQEASQINYPIFWDTDLVPVVPEAMAPADISIPLTILFSAYDDGTNRATLSNNITYQTPLVPSIFTELSMGENASISSVYGFQTNAYVLEHMDNIEIVLYNSDVNSHPFHLHGHKFQVVQISQDPTSNDTSINPPLVEGQANPIKRDTIMVPAQGLVTLRFRADNPGTWFFHCHIEWHLEAGLAIVFIEAPTQAQQLLKPPQAMFDQCASLGMPYTGNAVGLNSTTDLTGQPWGPFPQWHIIGWTTKAVGAMAGSILSCLVGVICVVWYSMHAFKDEEREYLAKEHYEEKKKKGGKMGAMKRLVQRPQH